MNTQTAIETSTGGLIVPLKMVAALPHATKLMLIAGAETTAAMSEIAPLGCAVVGIDDIYKWRDLKKVPLDALTDLITPSLTVYIYAKGRTSDAAVWAEVDAMTKHLSRKGASVLLLDDDAELSAVATDTAYITAMLSDAKANPGRKPGKAEVSKVAKALAPEVDLDDLSIVATDSQGGRAPLMNAAIVRDATYKLQDDLRDPSGREIERSHDLTVSYTYMGRRFDDKVLDVPSADLANPRRILDRVNTPGIDAVMISPFSGAGPAIENAIRASNPDALEVPIYRRTGWKEIDGRHGFMHLGGWITKEGNSTITRTKLGPMWTQFNFPDPRDGDRLAAARNSMAMADAVDLNLWIGVFGGLIHSAAGFGVGACINVVGGNGSGKSVSVQGITTHLSSDFIGKPMSTIDSSPAQIKKTGEGLDSLILVADDKRNLESRRSLDQASEVLEVVVRPSYSGHGALPAANVKDSRGNWVLGINDKSDYIRVLIGEELPEGDAQNSTRERLYPVPVTSETTFNGKNAEHFVSLADSPLPQMHFASFLQWVAGGMDFYGSREAWVESWAEIKAELYSRLGALTETHGVSRRVIEVAAVPLLGYIVWLRYLTIVGAATDEQAETMAETAIVRVEANALWHGTHNTNDSGTSGDLLIDSIRQMITSRVGHIETSIPGQVNTGSIFDPISETTPPIGKLVEGRLGNGAYVAMLPLTLVSMLKRHTGKEISSRVLIKTLAPIALTDEGKSTKRVNFNGVLVSAICIPLDVLLPGFNALPKSIRDDGFDSIEEQVAA